MSSSKPSSSSSSSRPPAAGAAPSTSVKHLDSLTNTTIEANLDGVLERVKTLDELCVYSKCKMKTNLMGQNCEFCRERYCFKHSLPEIHGCGEAVRRDERKKFLHPEPARTVQRREDLAKAKAKLHTKLNDMNLSRKQKPAAAKNTKK